ncbi:hypothetical protein BC332_13735 [Capsicum chinense]|nr:hypothetical protein BC332_13735 [Capsicum chinense]
MSKHANCSMIFDEIPSFSLGLTQDENINLISCNNQPKKSLNLQELRSKKRNDPQKSVEIMKQKAVGESLSPKSKQNQKTAKKRKPDQKYHSIPISPDYESSSEEEKVEEKKNCVVQTQLGRCIMSLETMKSSTSDIVIHAKGTTLHFSLREFVVVTGLNCHSNRDDLGFDKDVLNKIIDQYFDDSRFIQNKKLFVVVTDKIWGNENDEDVFKFANLYFIHGILLSSIDTVIISRLHFDLVESDRYRDHPWGLVAYEELAKSLNKKLKPIRKFYMLHGMPLAIQI